MKVKEYNFKYKKTVPKSVIAEMMKDSKDNENFIGTVVFNKNNDVGDYFSYIKGKLYIFKDKTEMVKWYKEVYTEDVNSLIVLDNRYKRIIKQIGISPDILVNIIKSALIMLYKYNSTESYKINFKDVDNFQKSCYQMGQVGIDYSKTLSKKDFIDKKILDINNDILGKIMEKDALKFSTILESTDLVEDKERLMLEYHKIVNKEKNVDYDLIDNLSKKIQDRYYSLKEKDDEIEGYKKSKDKVVKVDFRNLKKEK